MKKEVNAIIVCTIVLLLIVSPTLSNAFEIQPKYISVTAQGTPAILTITPSLAALKFKAGRQLSVSSTGKVESITPFDSKNCNSWVVAIDTITGQTDTCKVSIVPWTANLSSLKITEVISGGYKIYGKTGDTLVVNYNDYLYKTGSDFKKLIPMSPFQNKSAYYFAYLRTPAGSFIRNDKDIYFSVDEKKWVLDYSTKGRGIRNSFYFSYDSLSQTTRIFTHDYSVTGQDTFPHSVYRKTISPLKQNSQWEKVFTFFSKDQWAKDKSLFPACRHIHTVDIDPFTGQIWIGTGDDKYQSHIYYSDDNGNTWNQVGMGSQEWRVLSIWFTDKFIYWSMDSSETQKIFRISRDIYNSKGHWPDMSKKLSSGVPKFSVFYLIASLKTKKYFDYYSGTERFVGDIVRGNPNFQITEDNSLISLNDPALDYRELVATLPNSALWANATVVDNKGDRIIVISSNNEGHAIDYRPRVFGIKERLDGTVDIQELLSTDAGITDGSQFYPYEQDAVGNMYFQTLGMNSNVYKVNDIIKTALIWNDNSLSKGGEITDETSSRKNVRRKLKLIHYDGTILEWQQADSTFNWRKIKNFDNDLKDTLSVNREANKNKYIRAIVKKGNESPVASAYIKIGIDDIDKIDNVSTDHSGQDNLFKIYPNPVTDKLCIHVNNDTTSNCELELLTITGEKLFSQSYNFSSYKDLELDVDHLQQGVFLLKISNRNQFYIQKIIVK